MLKIKNKFIIFIIALIVLIISFGIFKSYFDNESNNNSYALLLNWKAVLNDISLELDTRSKLRLWDSVKTIWKDSLLVLEWWDGSVTRLWWNTSIRIDELYVSDKKWIINIKFELISWKTWSNIVSFLWEWSHFKEFFRDNEAAVRWTVFNLDLNNNYLNVVDHKVTLTKNDWDTLIVDDSSVLNINDFSFISLDDFINLFKDIDWEMTNGISDNEFFAWLKEQLYKDLNNINKFKDIDLDKIMPDVDLKQELYNKLLSDYQRLNFVKSSDEELFKTKLELKSTLIELAEPENKNKLIENTLYDFKDIIDSKEFWNLDFLLKILSKNKDVLINFDLNSYLDINSIPDNIKSSIFDDMDIFNNNIWEVNNTVNSGFDDAINNIIDTSTSSINNGINDIESKSTSFLASIKSLIYNLFNK